MERYLKIVVFFLCSLYMIGCTSSKKSAKKTQINKLNSSNFHQINKIAVLVKNNTGYHIPQIKSISNLFYLSALKKGYNIADPNKIEEVKKEIQFKSPHWDKNNISNLDNSYKITALLIVNFNQSFYGNNRIYISNVFNDYNGGFKYTTGSYTYTSSIAVNLISVKNNEILWANSFNNTITYNTYGSIKERPIITASRKVANKIPNRVN